MAIQAELHDGRILEFPDGTDPSVVQATVKKVLGVGAKPAAAPAPEEPAPQVFDPMGTGVGEAIMAQVPAKKESVLQGRQMPAPVVAQDKVVNPKFIDALKRNLDALPPEERQAKLDQFLQRKDVYGRAAKVIDAQYRAMEEAPEATKKFTDTRSEAIQQRLIEQGMAAEPAKFEAEKRALQGTPGLPLQQMTRDIVGEQASAAAAEKAKELEGAGFFKRVGAEMESRATQTGLGLMNIYADLTGDKEMQRNIQGAMRVEAEAGEAIPKGESIAEKSAQQAIATLAMQAPWILGSALVGTSGPVLAQAGIQVFGSEYGQGRQAGLSPTEAATRAGLLTSAELVFERYGLTETLKAVRGAVDRIPTQELAGYLAKAIAKELPAEQLTSTAQFLVDKVPGIGLNPNAGWKDFLEGQAETLRQTIIQSGAQGSAIMGTAKGAKFLAEKLGPEAPKYERDTSYEGMSEILARTKGFLVPPSAEEKPEEEPTIERKGVKPTLKPEERAARIDEIATMRMEAGVEPEDAVRMATDQVEREYGKAAEEVPKTEAPKNRVEQLTQDFIDAGEAPDNARVLAEQQVKQEEQADATAEATAKGAANVGKIVPPADRKGVPVVGQPSAVSAAPGVGEPVTDGMVPARPDVAAVAEGKGVQPSAVEDRDIYGRIEPKLEPLEPAAPTTAAAVAEHPAVKLAREKAAEAEAIRAGAVDMTTERAQRKAIEQEVEPMMARLRTAVDSGLASDADISTAQNIIKNAGSTAEALANMNRFLNEVEGGRRPTTTAEQTEDAEAQKAAEDTVGQLMEEVPKKPVAKRGRKAVVLTEEEKAQKDAAVKEYKRKYSKGVRDYDRAIAELNLAATPINEGEVENEEALKEKTAEKRAQLISGVRSLLSVEKNHRGTPLGNKAKALLSDRTKISQQVYDDIKKGWEATQHSKSLASSRAKPNEMIKGRMSAARVLNAIGKSGTPFERMLANRIRRALVGVTVYVVEKGDPVPPRMRLADNFEAWDRARGVYMAADDTGPREVYLRGASFGLQNGTNNVTALHELLHAALNHRIGAGLLGALSGKEHAQLVKLTRELSSLMDNARLRYEQLERAGVLPSRLQNLVEATLDVDPETLEAGYEIFELPQEFLAYGLSDPVFQEFLMGIEGRRTDESAFSRFVRSILEFLSLAPNQFTALSDLINITDDMLGAHTADLVLPSKGRAFMAAKINLTPEEKAAALAQRNVDRAVMEADSKFDTSKLSEEFAKGVSAAQMAQDPRTVVPALRALWNVATLKTRKGWVKIVPSEILAAMAGEDVPELKNTVVLLQKMNGLMMQLLKSAGELTKEIDRAYRKDPTLRDKLDRITAVSTLSEVDPSDPKTKKRSLELDKQYEALGPEGQRLYKRIKNHYESLSEYFTQLLNDQITRSGLPIAEQQNLLKKVRAMYEKGSKINPYFALVRRGDYWFSMGTGKNRVFTMFESLADRDRAIDGFLDLQVRHKPGETLADYRKRRQDRKDELFQDGTWGYGNDISSLRQKTTQSSQLLTGMFAAIEASELTSPEAKSQLMDDIYQLYLQTMPEQSFRKQFIHRKGLAGFRTDLLRNVADTTSKMAVQLSRIKYAPQLRNSLSQADDSIVNRPKFEPYVVEMRNRVNQALNPGKEGVAAQIADVLSKIGYVFYLGGAASALLQPLSLIQTGLPVLSRYGIVNANREFLKAMRLWKTLGVWKTNSDGTRTFVAPSLEFSSFLTEDERFAMRQLAARDLFTSTYANAVFNYKNTPTDKLSGPVVQLGKDIVNVTVLGGLMHSTERLTRELMALMAYRLNRQAGKTRDEAVNQVVFDTNEAFGNYNEYNRPTFMKGAAGKVMTQFMMYPIHVTLYLLRNFVEIIRPMDGRTRWEATKKFFGTLGATFVLGGAVALPMFSIVMGFIGAAWRALSGDDDRPKELRDMSFELWWRTKWLPEMLGGVEIGGVKLSTIVERGLLNAITGADFSSRVSLNNMWIRESKETKDVHTAAAEMALSIAGPAPNAIVSIAEGLSAFIDGDVKRGVQKMSPAGFRNFANTYYLWKEGAKDNKGAQILTRDAFTTGELLFQAVGFRPDLLANTQYINFKLIGIEQKINNERTKILEELDLHFRNKNFTEFSKTIKEDVAKFNRKYPTYALEADDITESIESKLERRVTSQRGVNVTEKNVGLFAPALKESRKAIREKEKAGRE